MTTTTFKNNMRVTGDLTVDGASLRTIATGTAAAGAVTLAATSGKVTTEALTTAQNGVYVLTITNSMIAAGDIVLASVANGTNSAATVVLGRVTPGAGSVVITVLNKHDTAVAFNGTLVVSFHVVKAATAA